MASKERKDLERKIEALIIAIPRESEANEFYLKLAEEYQDEASKEMFRFLAAQELKHRASLEHMLSGLEEKLAKLSK